MKVRGCLIEYHGNNVATFECAAGHRFRGPVIKKKPRGVGEQAIRVLVSWWSREKGGVTLKCRACEKAKLEKAKP